LYAKCYKLDDVKRVFKIECFQKDPQTFQRTHYSLSFTFKDPQFREVSMMEDALTESQWRVGLDERVKTGDFIRPYVIWGATGTGKTELCRWLELNIPSLHPDYEARRITKRELAMGGILGVAQALVGLEIDFADRLLSRHGDVGVEDVAVWSIGNLIKQGKITIQAENKDEVLRMIKTHIRKNIEERVKLIESAEDISKVETTLQFITLKDLNVLSYYGIEMDIGKVNREIYRALTPFVANVDDVKRLIFNFIKNRNDSGKIPVLIFDDVTHLGDLVDDFIAVITDISGGEEGYVCDFVIGTTTTFYDSKFRDALASTARARIFEVKLSPEEREDMLHANWLLGEDGMAHFLDFVLRYLDASRSCGGCSKCVQSPFIEKEYNYHPFTKTFLINFYNRIIREKEEPSRRGITVSITPRFVIQVLRNVLSNFVEISKPPSSFMDSSLILNTVDFFKLNQEDKEKQKEFLLALWWYGNHSKDGSRVAIDIKTLQQLDLVDQIPSHLKGKTTIELEVIPLHRALTEEVIQTPFGVGPKSPDDVSLMANIRSWCKDEGSLIALGPIVEGFNEVTRRLEENLSGANNFRNIMNFRSSREGETIEFVPPGQKECHFWVGELKDDNLQMYIFSKYKEGYLRPYQEKDFLFLTLNEDDFFRLHKIGGRTGTETERTKCLIEFLNSKRDELYDVLWRQRLKLKAHLERQLGDPVECFVLSLYVLVSKVLKSESLLTEIKEADDIKQLALYGIDLNNSDWSGGIINLIERVRLRFKTVEDLFYSFYSLRGEGSIIDYLLLQQTWLRIKKAPYQILEAVGEIDDRFILSKLRIKLRELGLFAKDLIDKLEVYSRSYNEDVTRKKIEDLRTLIAQVEKKDQLVKALELLREKLETQPDADSFELDSVISDLRNLQGLGRLLEKLDLIEAKIDSVKDFVDKAGLLVVLSNIGKDEVIEVAMRLHGIIKDIENRESSALESELARLREHYLKYLEAKRWF